MKQYGDEEWDARWRDENLPLGGGGGSLKGTHEGVWICIKSNLQRTQSIGMGGRGESSKSKLLRMCRNTLWFWNFGNTNEIGKTLSVATTNNQPTVLTHGHYSDQVGQNYWQKWCQCCQNGNLTAQEPHWNKLVIRLTYRPRVKRSISRYGN